MTKIIATILVILGGLSPICAHAACTGSSPDLIAASSGWTDVNECISAASTGDTINVPAGTSTWGTVSITKPITLKGNGIGNTNITAAISYTIPTPTVYSLWRFTGFTLSGTITVNNLTQYGTARIRIDNNTIYSTTVQIKTSGTVYGVIDSNAFSGYCHWDIYGGNSTSWSNIVFSYGMENNGNSLYIEDNTFDLTLYDTLSTLGVGGMVVRRYNTYDYGYSANNFYGHDMHGNQGIDSNHSSMGSEYYGEYYNTTKPTKLLDHRGGSSLYYLNGSKASFAQIVTRDECADCLNEHDPCIGPAPLYQPMHVSNSYYWGNRHGASIDTLVSAYVVENDSTQDCIKPTGIYEIARNTDFWADDDNGVRKGTLANIPSTCTTGQAYWSTTQSTTSLTGLIGAAPGSRLESSYIQGTLYKCTSTDTWTSYYTPYTYPHPLRGESTPVTTIPQGVHIGGGIEIK